MQRDEILNYLDMDASASLAEMQACIADKIKSLDALSESMGSDFLKKMHQKNIEKAMSVKAEIMALKDEPELPEPLSPAANDYIENEVLKEDVISPSASGVQDSILTTPVIIGSKSRQHAASNEPVGWLVRHTENQTAITFTIFSGKNYIGRKKQPGLAHFILIDDDVYISRVHAVIDAADVEEFEFYISDNESANLGKPSKNGTYINGDDRRISQKVRLLDNDTIQVGLTKLILKINRDNNLKKIVKEVQSSKFMDTVVIDSQ